MVLRSLEYTPRSYLDLVDLLRGVFELLIPFPKHSMGLPYMPISWGGARGVNVGKYRSPMGRVWVSTFPDTTRERNGHRGTSVERASSMRHVRSLHTNRG